MQSEAVKTRRYRRRALRNPYAWPTGAFEIMFALRSANYPIPERMLFRVAGGLYKRLQAFAIRNRRTVKCEVRDLVRHILDPVKRERVWNLLDGGRPIVVTSYSIGDA